MLMMELFGPIKPIFSFALLPSAPPLIKPVKKLIKQQDLNPALLQTDPNPFELTLSSAKIQILI